MQNKSIKKNNNSGQVSLEYLLILVAFFATLSLILPIIFFSIDEVFFVIDAVNIRKIANIIEKNDELFLFLANDSFKKIEFDVIKKINIITQGRKLIISSREKEFIVMLNDEQSNFNKKFETKFYVEIKKENGKTKFNFYN